MACNNCTNLQLVPQCIDEVILGSISSIGASIFIVVTNIATQRTHIQSAVSGSAGEVTLDLTNPSSKFFMPDQAYEIHVSLQISNNVYNKEDWTIDGNTDTCYNLEFATLYTSTGQIWSGTPEVIVDPVEDNTYQFVADTHTFYTSPLVGEYYNYVVEFHVIYTLPTQPEGGVA